MRKLISVILIVTLIFLVFVGCTERAETSNSGTGVENVEAVSTSINTGEWDDTDAKSISLSGSGITIESGGVYVLSGNISDGQVHINTGDEEEVQLVLNGVDIYCSNSSCIYVENAELITITIATGSTNILSDGDNYALALEEDEPDAAIFSKDDLVINGGGTLNISGNYSNGITGKDDLTIENGIITISAINNGIKGKDSVTISQGTFLIISGNDGIKATNITDAGKGWVDIQGGTFDIESSGDGIQAETIVSISGGTFNIETGGGSSNASTKEGWGIWNNIFYSDETTDSAKGIKAGASLIVSGGTININSSDDCLHSNGTGEISGGELTLCSGDDGIHTDSTLDITGGMIAVTKSYEGIEGLAITISDGILDITASDDGLNAGGGNDQSAMGRPGAGTFDTGSSDCFIRITGGKVIIDASGDGIDSNGALYVAGGEVIVSGANNGGNGALDYASRAVVTGGTSVIYGSSEMAMNFTSDSSQYSVMFSLGKTYSEGVEISLRDDRGNDIVLVTAEKSFSNVVISTPDFVGGEEYTLYIDGTAVSTQTLTNIITGSGSMGDGIVGMGPNDMGIVPEGAGRPGGMGEGFGGGTPFQRG